MIKQKNIRDKMRYSSLSNNMMISELWTTITIQIQYSQARLCSSQASWWADGTHDRDNSAPELAEPPPPPPPHQIIYAYALYPVLVLRSIVDSKGLVCMHAWTYRTVSFASFLFVPFNISIVNLIVLILMNNVFVVVPIQLLLYQYSCI
jgi:hypothetical protein